MVQLAVTDLFQKIYSQNTTQLTCKSVLKTTCVNIKCYMPMCIQIRVIEGRFGEILSNTSDESIQF